MVIDAGANSILRDDSNWCQNLGALICLRLVVALQCLGIAGRYLLTRLESESHIFEYLLFESGISEGFAQRIDDVVVYLCFAAGVVLILNLWRSPAVDSSASNNAQGKPSWTRGLNWLEMTAATLVAIWFIADAMAFSARGGAYSEFAIGEVAVRFACPAALILMLSKGSFKTLFPSKGALKSNAPREGRTGSELLSSQCRLQNRRAWIARWILTIAVSVTFMVHGFKATQLFGPFCDLILLTDMRIFHLDLSQSTVEKALLIIGWVDIALAVAILLTRYRLIAIYMLIWGLMTSLSRVTAFGWQAWPETVVRAANWGAVLAIMIIWRCEVVSGKDPKPVEEPQTSTSFD